LLLYEPLQQELVVEYFSPLFFQIFSQVSFVLFEVSDYLVGFAYWQDDQQKSLFRF
jgi:hypothetical protein